jgi:hypothetical protein
MVKRKIPSPRRESNPRTPIARRELRNTQKSKIKQKRREQKGQGKKGRKIERERRQK